jgi:hypothetical protein
MHYFCCNLEDQHMATAKAGATLPGKDARLKPLKKTEYYWLGNRVKARCRIVAGTVIYDDGVTDATIAEEGAAALGAAIEERHVISVRKSLFGHLPDEGASMRERLTAMAREVSGLSSRVRRIEEYLDAEMKQEQAAITPPVRVEPHKKNGAHN